MALLDVNALVALVWDSHVHHVAAREWFAREGRSGWSTCPVTESGFVRVSSNPSALPSPVGVETARDALRALRRAGRQTFLANDVSLVDGEIPPLAGHRQVTGALLLAVARRHGTRLVTFDGAIAALAQRREEVELLAR